MLKLDEIVDRLNLVPHPEGGLFSESYRSSLELPKIGDFKGSRPCSTGIYFLLTSGTRSHLHRIKSDEIWHFYHGGSLRIVMLDLAGNYSEKLLGPQLGKEESFQVVVPAGVWFGAEVIEGGEYTLVGCTVSPGFDYSDFEMAQKEQMLKLYPSHQTFLEKYCLS